MLRSHKTIAVITAFGIALCAAQAGYAAQKGGVKIGGNLEQTTQVRTNLNMALGKNVTARTSIGSIHQGVKVGGNVKQTTRVRTNLNMALGKNAVATTAIGSVGVDY